MLATNGTHRRFVGPIAVACDPGREFEREVFLCLLNGVLQLVRVLNRFAVDLEDDLAWSH